MIGPDDDPIAFAIWLKTGSDADARAVHAPSPRQAAELCAEQDWLAGHVDWPVTYYVRDPETGTIYAVDVAIASQPTFVAIDVREVEMGAGTHVLWGGRVLCEDLRLRGFPRYWPLGQRWISLADVAAGTEAPEDACAACWAKAPTLVDGLRQIVERR